MIQVPRMTNPIEVGKNSFCHAGDAGDCCYSLPTIKALGGGTLYLNLVTGIAREPMTPQKRDWLAPLLEAQEYIKSVEMYRGQAVAYNLNYFRNYWREHLNEFGVSLAEWHCRAFEVDPVCLNKPWLECEAKLIEPVVIHRSERYQNKDFDWKRVLEKYKGQCVFIGLEQEHRKFTGQFSYLPFYKVTSALDMAQVINGAKLFVGNQSFPNAVAEGLKKPKILEVWAADPNTIFERPDLQAVWSRTMYLPEV